MQILSVSLLLLLDLQKTQYFLSDLYASLSTAHTPYLGGRPAGEEGGGSKEAICNKSFTNAPINILWLYFDLPLLGKDFL